MEYSILNTYYVANKIIGISARSAFDIGTFSHTRNPSFGFLGDPLIIKIWCTKSSSISLALVETSVYPEITLIFVQH